MYTVYRYIGGSAFNFHRLGVPEQALYWARYPFIIGFGIVMEDKPSVMNFRVHIEI